MKLDRRASLRAAAGVMATLLAFASAPVLAEGPKNTKPKLAKPAIPVVLHLGDSFVNAGFRQALKPKIEQAGARYIVRAKHSIYIPTLPRELKVSSLMWNYRPSLVILTIGANEMRMPNPPDHAGAVRRLSQLVSQHGASCVWVTPPPPKSGETGIVKVIKDNSSPCRVYDSTTIAESIPRGFDHVHPTMKGGAMWANAFWKWLEEQRQSASTPWTLKPRRKPESAAKSKSESVSP